MKTRYDIIDQVIKDMGYEVTDKARKIMDEEFSSEIPYWYIPE